MLSHRSLFYRWLTQIVVFSLLLSTVASPMQAQAINVDGSIGQTNSPAGNVADSSELSFSISRGYSSVALPENLALIPHLQSSSASHPLGKGLSGWSRPIRIYPDEDVMNYALRVKATTDPKGRVYAFWLSALVTS